MKRTKSFWRKFKSSKYFWFNMSAILVVLILIGIFLMQEKLKKDGKIMMEKYYLNIKNDKNKSQDFLSTISTSTDPLTASSTATTTSTSSNVYYKSGTFVRIVDSCNYSFGGACVRARSCPSTSCPVVQNLRDGMVLKTNGEIIEADGITWYHIVFDEWRRYADRIPADLYISSEFLSPVESYTTRFLGKTSIKKTQKEIIVSLSKQKLYAYDGDDVFMTATISTGLEDLPTPRGTFQIYSKTPSRYMQGPIDGVTDQYYDLPGVPWTMYFTYGGAAIHGTYWHNNFGTQWSHGCVNLVPEEAEKLYNWADLGTKVIVKD